VVAKTIWNKGKADAGFLLLLEREREREHVRERGYG